MKEYLASEEQCRFLHEKLNGLYWLLLPKERSDFALDRWQLELLMAEDWHLFRKYACKEDSLGNNVIHYAALTGNIAIIQALNNWDKTFFSDKVVQKTFPGRIRLGAVFWAFLSRNTKMLDWWWDYSPSLFNETDFYGDPLILQAIAGIRWIEGIQWINRHKPELLFGKNRKWGYTHLGVILSFISTEMLDWFRTNNKDVLLQIDSERGIPVLLFEAVKTGRIDVLQWIEQNEDDLGLLAISRQYVAPFLLMFAWTSGSRNCADFIHKHFGKKVELGHKAIKQLALLSSNPEQVNYALSLSRNPGKISFPGIMYCGPHPDYNLILLTLNKTLDSNFTLNTVNYPVTFELPDTPLIKSACDKINKKLVNNTEWPKNFSDHMKKAVLFYLALKDNQTPADILFNIGSKLIFISVPSPELFSWDGFFQYRKRYPQMETGNLKTEIISNPDQKVSDTAKMVMGITYG